MDQAPAARKVLIVEDEIHLAEALKIRLEDLGFSVALALDGQEGLLKAKKELPDIIVLDLMLPRLDGLKVCRLLKFDDRYKHIPIIILSARREKHDMDLAFQMGADLFVPKPYRFNQLLEKINALLAKSGSDPVSERNKQVPAGRSGA